MKSIFSLIVAITVTNCANSQILMPIINRGATAASCSLSYTTNLSAWYKADAVTCTSGCTTGNAVTSWADQSTNSNNLTSAVAGTYQAAQINGKAAVLFDGASTYYTFGAPIDLTAASGVYIFAVIKATAASPKGTLVSGLTFSVGYWFTSTSEQGIDSVFNAGVASGTAAADTSWHQTNMLFVPASNYALRIDKASDGSGVASATIGATETQVGRNAAGSSEYFNGYLAELLIFNADITTTNRDTVESYLNCRYGL